MLCCGHVQMARAQASANCESLYLEALRLYSDGLLGNADRLSDSLSRSCANDRDQLARILFLRTLIAAREDSIASMRRNLERLFRNDRNYVLKPYDPLLIAILQRDELYTEYQLLFGSREMGAGALRKDHGRLRGGFMGALVFPQLEVMSERIIFEEDGPSTMTPKQGWYVGGTVEYDVLPNWALRIGGGITSFGFRANNKAVRYEEDIALYDISLAVRKSFWLKDPRWVPYLLGGAGLGSVRSVDAFVERSGDGVRLLGPLSLERSAERTRYPYRAIAGAGVAYKVGHTVLLIEGRYEQALTDHTLSVAPWTESELLVRYYYVDNNIRLSQVSLAFGIQYIIRYHSRNRIHP